MRNIISVIALLIQVLLTGILINSCHNDNGLQVIQVYPDSVLNDVSNHPLGINLNFMMDDKRFPEAVRSVSEAVREMGMKYLRYPGGEKSDLYLFGKSPYDTPEPALARSVGLDDYPGMFTKDMSFVYDPLDFDEYIAVCRATGAEPVVVVAADNYLRPLKYGQWVSSREELLHHAVEWVRYANIKKKYNVRYWMIANESWNNNNVNSNADIYAQDVIDFSKAMKEVDPTVLIIANGAGDAFYKTVITKAGDYIDRLTVSNYGVYNFFRGYDTYRDTSQILIWPAINAIKAMHTWATPSQLNKLKMIVAEYGTIDWARLWDGTNDMGHAIVAFDMTGQLLQQKDIEFSCFWNTRWIENGEKPGKDHDAIDENGNLYPTGQALRIWGNFLGNQMIKSDTLRSIITFASYNPHSQELFAYLINKGEKTETIKIEIRNNKTELIQDAWELYGNGPEDINPVWQQIPRLKPGNPIDLRGTSITIIKMKIKE